MRPEDIRSAIESNPQSPETRTYLIQQAVENDMADEVPDNWTLDLHDPDNEYDDTEDLIADSFQFDSEAFEGPITSGIEIDAHESGAISVRILPNIEPIIKFDLTAADRLIHMLNEANSRRSYVSQGEQIPPTTIEPSTGITIESEVEQDERYGRDGSTLRAKNILVIPTDENDYRFDLDIMGDLWIDGLTAMANAAETYGRQDVPQ